ncbi:unnamed protein product [Diamesa tonsa]
MFTAEKISALFNATILLGHYPQFYSFIFNENVKDFQNVPGKLWELREYNMTMIQNDNRTFVAGSGEILEKFRGIYNEPVCNLKQSSIEHICKNENVAEVWSLHQVEE